MSSPMQPLVKVGHQYHPLDEKYGRTGRQRYGQPRLALYWASPWSPARFAQPGLYLWNGKRNVRVLPLPSCVR